MAITVAQNSVDVSSNGTVTVANIVTRTNTVHFACLGNSGGTLEPATVNVFSTYAEAAAMTATGGAVVPVNQTLTVRGNFAQTAGASTIYVACINAAGLGSSVFATPVVIGSD